jgi:hypothetical protein
MQIYVLESKHNSLGNPRYFPSIAETVSKRAGESFTMYSHSYRVHMYYKPSGIQTKRGKKHTKKTKTE